MESGDGLSGTILVFLSSQTISGVSCPLLMKRAGVSGAISSGIGSYDQGLNMNSGLMVASTTVMGGVSVWLTGGDFLMGAMNGLQIGMLNHAMHDGGIRYYRDQNGNICGEVSEVVVRAPMRTSLAAGIGIEVLGVGFSAYGASRYYKSPFGSEYWRTSSGRFYDSSILQRQSNGKYVRGVQGIRNSKELAKKSVRVPSAVGKTFGGLGVGSRRV